MKLKRTKQCEKCPWRKDVDPHDIPNGYCPTKCARGTVAELQSFAKEQQMPSSDGEFLFHHFEGKGWKDVKDWRAHFRKWKSAKWLPSQKGIQTGVRVRTEPANVNL